MSDVAVSQDEASDHRVTPLELFFDLVFVFAITQVTSLLANEPAWAGVLRGMLVLAAAWWTWTGYAWLTSAIDVDEGGVRLAMLAAMIAMLGVALAVPVRSARADRGRTQEGGIAAAKSPPRRLRWGTDHARPLAWGSADAATSSSLGRGAARVRVGSVARRR